MDQPGVEGGGDWPHDPVMDGRVTRLEDDMRDVRAILSRLEPMIVRIDATMPHLARRSDLADLRTELKGDMAHLRTELKGDMADLQTKLKGDMADLRTELKGDMASLRTELKGDMDSLRTELKGDTANLRTDLSGGIAELRTDMVSEFGKVRVELASKASLAGVWTVDITLLGLTVGGMAAGAIYLPFLFRVMHLPPP